MKKSPNIWWYYVYKEMRTQRKCFFSMCPCSPNTRSKIRAPASNLQSVFLVPNSLPPVTRRRVSPLLCILFGTYAFNPGELGDEWHGLADYTDILPHCCVIFRETWCNQTGERKINCLPASRDPLFSGRLSPRRLISCCVDKGMWTPRQGLGYKCFPLNSCYR